VESVFITGNSRGIGLALTRHYLSDGFKVAGCSRQGCQERHVNLTDMRCDLAQPDQIEAALQKLFASQQQLDLVVLNAALLGDIAEVQNTPLAHAKQVMDVNLWANKVILDWFLSRGICIKQIVFMSTGASVVGYRGLTAYSLSKSALNMLCQLYTHEFPDTHLAALAPGIVDTAMQEKLCDVDVKRFPAMQSLKDARGTPMMPTPAKAAEQLVWAFTRLKSFPSGSFVDLRELH
jgi:NAD(P)-dependent dehydrogenase (short-subunit alcohol dehydrogenase family)